MWFRRIEHFHIMLVMEYSDSIICRSSRLSRATRKYVQVELFLTLHMSDREMMDSSTWKGIHEQQTQNYQAWTTMLNGYCIFFWSI